MAMLIGYCCSVDVVLWSCPRPRSDHRSVRCLSVMEAGHGQGTPRDPTPDCDRAVLARRRIRRAAEVNVTDAFDQARVRGRVTSPSSIQRAGSPPGCKGYERGHSGSNRRHEMYELCMQARGWIEDQENSTGENRENRPKEAAMPNLAPWVVVVVGIVVLAIAVVSGQRVGFRSMTVIGILIGAGAVLAGLRWRRRIARPSNS
jgi:hypothetical protein